MAEFQARRSDPFFNYKFRLVSDTDGDVGGFTEIGGLGEQNEVIEYREGNDPITPRKYPGRMTFDDLECKRGAGANNWFMDWRAQVSVAGVGGNMGPDNLPGAAAGSGGDFRRQLAVELYDAPGNKVMEWEIYEAWPPTWKYETLNAQSSEILIETLTVTHEGCRRVL